MGPSINYLTKEQYEAITPVASNLYICTDTHEAFKGTENIQDIIRYAAEVPEVGIENAIYCVNKNLFLYSEGEWISITQVILDQVELILDPTKHVTKEQLKDAMDEVEGKVPQISFEGLYAKVKAAGYLGTEKIFVDQLAEVLNYTDKIMYNEESGVPVVEVDGQEYANVSEAVAALEDGGELVFTRNTALTDVVEINANNVTVDMAGKLLEMSNKYLKVNGTDVVIKNANIVDNTDLSNPSLASSGIVIGNDATVTIQDSAIDSRTMEVIYIKDGGHLVLDNVDITSSVDADYAAGRYDAKSLVLADGGTIEIKGGSIIADTSSDLTCGLYPISAWNGCSIVLGDLDTKTGPTIIGNSACIGSNNTANAIDNIVIYGGEYKSLMAHPDWMGVIYAGDSANITVLGGSFDGGDYDIALPYIPADYNVVIEDGKFFGKTVIKKDYKKGGSGPQLGDHIAITGGLYAYEVPAEFIVQGYGCGKRLDGWFEVLPINEIDPNYLVCEGTAEPYVTAGADAIVDNGEDL